ncbi:tripartite tricarboxylate transporter TctB family protein [Granulosicoccus sp. 3-233]|uniref:tripartite tricarboxylate transporter TctB family protein n=1 Tax=Granulosicoccus sp. 3-233 TaxID=3417969 RepID=UPI003D35467A
MSTLLNERRCVSVVILLLVAGLVTSTFGLTFADLGGAFSPMFFPRIILTILLALAAFNVVLDLLKPSPSDPIELWPVLTISLAFIVYVLLLVPLGYFVSSVALGMVVLLALGLRHPLQVVLPPVLAAGALLVLFNHVLKMPLPTSPFTWWI